MRDATQALTVLAEIDPLQRATLDARLAAIADDLDHNPVFRPKDLPHTHFMRFVVLEQDGELPALLAWECNHDRRTREYLEQALDAVSLDPVFECCLGYPPPSRRDDTTRIEWLLRHAVPAAAFYAAYRGIPREQVLNDRRVHDAIRDKLDKHGGRAELSELPDHEIQRQLREHVRNHHPELATAPTDDQALRWALAKALVILRGLVLLVPLLVIAIPWLLVLRWKEHTDPADANTRPVHDDKDLAALEDKVTQNQLTHVVEIKPGWFRYATLRFVLYVIDLIARAWEVRGSLGGITSIHFARWVFVKDRWSAGRKRHRLLFFSNYDGSWESYLGEFVDRAAFGLTGVWSNTVGFPRTRWLIRDGAKDEEAFKQWTRRHQIVTQVWWSGVPDSTVQNILDDLWIRRHLEQTLTRDDMKRWLRTL